MFPAAHLQLHGGCISLQLPPKLMSALHPLQPLHTFPWLHHPARAGCDLGNNNAQSPAVRAATTGPIFLGRLSIVELAAGGPCM